MHVGLDVMCVWWICYRYVRHLDSSMHAIQIKTKLCQLVEAVSLFPFHCCLFPLPLPPPPISLPSSLQQWFCILFTCCLIFYAHADSYGPNVYRDKYFGVWTQQFLRTFSQRQRHDWETSLERCGSPQGWIGWTQLPVLKIVTTFWHALFALIYSGRWDGGRGGCEESKFLVF